MKRLLALTTLFALFALSLFSPPACGGLTPDPSSDSVGSPWEGTMGPSPLEEADEPRLERTALPAIAAPKLKPIYLPEGDSGSINVGWFPGTRTGATVYDPKAIKAEGFDGLLFVGKGKTKSHLRCTSWDGNTVAIGRGDWIVAFKGVTIHSGYYRAIVAGEQNKSRVLSPGFQLRFLGDVDIVADRPHEYFFRERQYRLLSGGVRPGELPEAKGTDQELGYRVGDVLRPDIAWPGSIAPEWKVTKILDSDGDSDGDGRLELADADGRGPIDTEHGLTLLRTGNYETVPVSDFTLTGGSGRGAIVHIGTRAWWLVFLYNCDLYAFDVRLIGKEAVEHDIYVHGFARYGALIRKCTFESSGAEGFKLRSDTTETAWAGPEARLIIEDTTFRDWYQPWSWRGGAAIVVQGGACDIRLERLVFYGGEPIGQLAGNDRCKAIMISSEGLSYGHGTADSQFGNGHVLIRSCAMWGTSIVDWRNTIIRVGRNGGGQMAARSVSVQGCSIWGPNMFLQFGEVPTGKVTVAGCNTPELRAFAESLGMDTRFEAIIPTSRRIPVSEGFVR